MNHIQNSVRKSSGFTLVELMVVIIIVGILAAYAAREYLGYIEKAEASQITSTINAIDSEINSLSKTHRLGNCASSSRLMLSGNNMLDVLAGGEDFVAANLKLAFQNEPKASLSKGLTQLTAPSAGTAGTYAVGKYPLSIQPCSTSENIYRLDNVPTSVLMSILFSDYKDLSTNFAAATPVTTGALQYTAADANGEHQVSFYIKR